MRTVLGFTLVIALGVTFGAGCQAPQTHFGEPMKENWSLAKNAGELCAHPDKYEGKYVKVAGYVKDLCTHSGCWMELADDPDAAEDGILVVFTYDREKHGRIPAEAKGHKATVEGKVVLATITEEQRREEAVHHGATPDEVAKIKGDKQMVKIECPAVKVAGVEAAENKPCTHEHEDDHG